MNDTKTAITDRGHASADRFDQLFRPRSVAIVGASEKRGGPRNTVVRVLQHHGFTGDIYPVSRSADEIEGLKAYRTVADLPVVPDVALIITPAAAVPDLVAECGEKGIQTAIVFSSGFEETENGKDLACRLKDNAERYGMTLLGPNAQGLWSVREKALLTFGSAAADLPKTKHAPVAVVSQSGALGGALAGALHRTGIGCSYIVSVGNESVVDMLDVLAWIVEQDDVRVVALYIEGLTDGRRIIPIAARAAARGVQIVAIKTGRSEAGQAATASHTGKIASADAVYTDVFAQAGVVMVDSIAELLAAVEVFGFLPDPKTGDAGDGSGLSIISSSGGAAALLADHSEMLGVPLATFSDATKVALKEVVADFASIANPIDLAGPVRSAPALFKQVCQSVCRDPATEALIIQFASSGRKDLVDNADVLRELAATERLPIVVSLVADMVEPDLKRELLSAGILVTNDTLTAMKAVQGLFRRRGFAHRGSAIAERAISPSPAPTDWQELMDYLEASDVTPAKWTILHPGDHADTACADLSYPLVVKVLPDETDHKTELGLVKLRVASASEVDAHADDFRSKLAKPDLEVLVQEMVGDGVEVVMSCLRATDFGPILTIGSGGVAVELYRDVVHLALPVTPADVEAALGRLKLSTLLRGFRGKPAADVHALARAAAAFGDRFLATGAISEFEVNPLIVRAEGAGVVAVDALVVTA